MEEYIVSTLPIEIKDKLKIGTLTAVEYASIIAKKTDCHSVLYLNGLNSFRTINTDTTELQAQLKYYGINIDELILDTEIKNKNLLVLQKLFRMGFIIPQKKKILKCNCGRVEIVEESLRSHSIKTILDDTNGLHCRICHSECSSFSQNVLSFRIDSKVQMNVVPQSTYANNFTQFSEQYHNSEILISRSRETGITFMGYNIDVDFFWSLFVGIFTEKKVVIVSSNSHLFKLYLINQIGTYLGKELFFVIHPRIVRKPGEHISIEIDKYDYLYRNLILLYSPKWKTLKCFYNIGVMKYLARIRGHGRKKLFDFLSKKFEKTNYYIELKSWIEDEINLQDNIIEVLK